MYNHYQNMRTSYVPKHNIQNEYDNIMLITFFDQIRKDYSVDMLWVIYFYLNVGLIDRFRLNLKDLPQLEIFLEKDKQLCGEKIFGLQHWRDLPSTPDPSK